MDSDFKTAFLFMQMDGTFEEINSALLGRTIHAAISSPQNDGAEEWSISMIPIGIVTAWDYEGSILKVVLELLHGEVDRV